MHEIALAVELGVIPVDRISSITAEPNFDEDQMNYQWVVLVVSDTGREFIHSRHSGATEARSGLDTLVTSSLGWFVVDRKVPVKKTNPDSLHRAKAKSPEIVYEVTGFDRLSGCVIHEYEIPSEHVDMACAVSGYIGPGERPLSDAQVSAIAALTGVIIDTDTCEYYIGTARK